MHPLTLLSFLLNPFFVLSTVAEDAFRVGNGNWGMEMYITSEPRECAPIHLYYDINLSGDPPSGLVLPDDAAISFLTPDSSLTQWMVLRPPMGTGILSWMCSLRAGKQFVVQNRSGYKQVFTVGSAPSSSQCGQNASSVTTSSSYGSLDAEAYKSLTSTNYAPLSISPANQFSSHTLPGSAGLKIVNVFLGASNATPTAETAPTTKPPEQTLEPPPDQTQENGGTGNDGGSSSLVPPITTQSSAASFVSQTSDSNLGTSVTPSTNSDGSNSGNGSQSGATQSVDKSRQGPGSLDAPDGTNNRVNIKAIVAGALGALVLIGIVGVMVFHSWRSRRRRIRMAKVSPIAPVTGFVSSSAAITHRDRKYELLSSPNRKSVSLRPSTQQSSESGLYGNSTAAVGSSGPPEAPPLYSRFS